MNRRHKILQEMQRSLNRPQLAAIDAVHLTNPCELVINCLMQWRDTDAIPTYPSKAFNDAAIYARLLEHHFGCLAIQYLDDPHLFTNLAPYFETYSEYPELYDLILEDITYESIATTENNLVKSTVERFNQEFMIGSCEYKLLTKLPSKH